jgi:hypothetical protein
MDAQERADRLYWKQGPCCAGCDHWRSSCGLVGECTLTAPMAGKERLAMIGIRNCSLSIGAGHAFTPHDHRCGQFKDEFDWTSLPLFYRRKIGCPA